MSFLNLFLYILTFNIQSKLYLRSVYIFIKDLCIPETIIKKLINIKSRSY